MGVSNVLSMGPTEDGFFAGGLLIDESPGVSLF